MERIRLAFVSGLSNKKLSQKLAPLQALPEVRRIDLYRRQPLYGDKIQWMPMPRYCSRIAPIGDLWRLATLIRNAPRYDVIIGCHQFFHGVYAASAALLRGRQNVQLTIKDPARIQKSKFGSWALRHANAIGFRGETTLAQFRTTFGNNRHFFIPHNVWQPSTTIPQGKKVIDLMYVGNFAFDKNISAWLEVAAKVKQRRGTLEAVLVGETPSRKITAQVDRLGLRDDLKFTGPLLNSELYEQYMHAKVLLLTSRWEGLPMVALEAMAAGVPVVATDIGDIRDLVKNGTNGYLVPVGAVEEMVKAVVKLLDDEALYPSLSKMAHEAAADLLSESTLESVTNQWRHLFVEMGLMQSL